MWFPHIAIDLVFVLDMVIVTEIYGDKSPKDYLHFITFPYHQVLLATAGNAVVTSAFVYIKCRMNNYNNNKQMCKSKNVFPET